jgi:four helix bundle protein
MKIARFEEIESWKVAREVTTAIYALTRRSTFDADVDLRRQMRKAATSIMANIAEGFDAGTTPEFRRYLRIARKSANELQSHLYVCLDESYLARGEFDRIYGRIGDAKGLIGGFIRYLIKADRRRSGGFA